MLFSTRFTNSPVLEDPEKEVEKEENAIDRTPYPYQQYGRIKLYHSKTGETEEIPLDEYLYGVVAAEMPASFEKEALKAQAIVARTYTIYKITSGQKHEGASICDDSTCCQAWISKEDRFAKWKEEERQSNWDKIVSAVQETKGKMITYEGKAINAFFHSNSGGRTETPAGVWGGEGYPYLQVVETAGEDAYSQYASEVTISKQELVEKLKAEHPEVEIDFSKQDWYQILEYTQGDRIKTIRIGNVELSGVEVRTLIGLRSANFTITMEEENVTFEVKGYGHGVGMSQTGADSLAKQGQNWEQIIHHFYQGVEIINMN